MNPLKFDAQKNAQHLFKVVGPITKILILTNLEQQQREKKRNKILVMLAANQPLENTIVPQDQDLGQWSSYLKKKKKTPKATADHNLYGDCGKQGRL